MARLETIIAVKDVAKSSKWYQGLLNFKSNHGGDNFEMLANQKGEVIFCLHRWDEHDHPTMKHPNIAVGNGLILYFRVSELNAVWCYAVRICMKIQVNNNLF